MKINVEFSSLSDMANFTKFINDSLVPPTQKQLKDREKEKSKDARITELETALKDKNSRLEQLLDRAYTRLRMADPEGKTANKEELKTVHNIPKEVLDAPLDILELTTRAQNSLVAENIYTIGQLMKQTENELLRFPNMGRKSLKHIKEQLEKKFNLTLELP
jgi:DNA-directed RNA polymerase alpha subunit